MTVSTRSVAVTPSGRQLAGQFEAHNGRQQHRYRLAEHAGFGFNSADAPADDAEPADHRCVRIGADAGVGISFDDSVGILAGEDDRGQIFEVHLMHDSGTGRHRAEVAERFLRPAEQRVTLAIALVFEHHVQSESVLRGVGIDLHGVIDDEVAGDQGIRELRIGAQFLKSIAHGGEIDDAGDSGEVLEDDAGGAIVDVLGRGGGVPLGDVLDVGALDGRVILITQQVLEDHADRVRKARHGSGASCLFDCVYAIDSIRFSACLERCGSVERVSGRHIFLRRMVQFQCSAESNGSPKCWAESGEFAEMSLAVLCVGRCPFVGLGPFVILCLVSRGSGSCTVAGRGRGWIAVVRPITVYNGWGRMDPDGRGQVIGRKSIRKF